MSVIAPPPTPDQVRAAQAAKSAADLAADRQKYKAQVYLAVCDALMRTTEHNGVLKGTVRIQYKFDACIPLLGHLSSWLDADFPGWSIVPIVDVDSDGEYDYLKLTITERTTKSA